MGVVGQAVNEVGESSQVNVTANLADGSRMKVEEEEKEEEENDIEKRIEASPGPSNCQISEHEAK